MTITFVITITITFFIAVVISVITRKQYSESRKYCGQDAPGGERLWEKTMFQGAVLCSLTSKSKWVGEADYVLCGTL